MTHIETSWAGCPGWLPAAATVRGMWTRLSKRSRVAVLIGAALAVFTLGTIMGGTEVRTEYVYSDDADPNIANEESVDAACETFDTVSALVDRQLLEQVSQDDEAIEVGMLSLAWQAKGTRIQDAAYQLAKGIIDDSHIEHNSLSEPAIDIAAVCELDRPPTPSSL